MERSLYYIKNNKLFLFGLFLKLVMICFLFSPITNRLFVPFIDYYTSTGLNPYMHFLSIQKDSFPYPAVMLYILSSFKMLLWFFPTEISIKIVLLLADITIYFILISWLQKYKREVVWLYWLSPVLIYINYMHGQLDVIQMALLFVSLFYLFKERVIISIIFLALSVSTKSSAMLIVPFFYIYLYYQFIDTKTKFFGFVALFVALLFVFNINYIFDDSFIKTVLLNDTQNIIFGFSIPIFNANYIYPCIMLYIFLIFQAILIRIKTREVFIVFACFSFGLIMVFIQPTPGWYYWIIPLWIYFYVSSTFRGKLLFVFLQASFLIYFLVIPNSDYIMIFKNIFPSLSNQINLYQYLVTHNINMLFIDNLLFTVLQTVLILNVYWIYRRGVDCFSNYKMISKPLLVGVGGDSGAGKTTVSEALVNVFGQKNVANIYGDDIHKWERGNKQWSSHTHLDPQANNLHFEYVYLKNLKYERTVSRKHYNHTTGKFNISEEFINAKRLIIYDGLHPFYLKKVRELFDLKIFIKPDEMLTAHWKIIRDTINRGYSIEKVIEQIKNRKQDYNKYILPQEKFADIVIYPKLAEPLKCVGSEKEKPKIYLEIKCNNSIYMEFWLQLFTEIKNITIHHQYCDDDGQIIKFMNPEDLSAEQIMGIGGEYIDFNKLGINNPVWLGGFQGIIQLFILYYILETNYDK